jgi:ABC-type sugar transport system substrate-binding protein
MRRRAFIQGIAGSAAVGPPVARAQPGRLPTIGFLGASTQVNWTQWTAAFVQRLRELG